jgi:hypothetical protein
MHFLLDGDIAKSIGQSLATSRQAKLAVAYWGNGAVDLLNLSNFSEKAQVICDAFSGSCNPSELSVLIEKHDVKYISGLHAKVYWTEGSVVIGSANASINGLKQQGPILRYEASVAIKDQTVIDEVKIWFDKIFAKAQIVDDRIIKAITPIWTRAQSQRPWPHPRQPSLIEALQLSPEDFSGRPIYALLPYPKLPSDTIREFRKVRGLHYSKADLEKYDKEEILPIYEDNGNFDTKAGDYFMDYSLNSRSSLTYNGLWRVRFENWRHKIAKNRDIIFVDRVSNFDGIKVRPSDGRTIGKALKALIEKNES